MACIGDAPVFELRWAEAALPAYASASLGANLDRLGLIKQRLDLADIAGDPDTLSVKTVNAKAVCVDGIALAPEASIDPHCDAERASGMLLRAAARHWTQRGAACASSPARGRPNTSMCSQAPARPPSTQRCIAAMRAALAWPA